MPDNVSQRVARAAAGVRSPPWRQGEGHSSGTFARTTPLGKRARVSGSISRERRASVPALGDVQGLIRKEIASKP